MGNPSEIAPVKTLLPILLIMAVACNSHGFTSPVQPAVGWELVVGEPVLAVNYDTLDGLPNDPWIVRDPADPGTFIMYYGALKGDFTDPWVRIFRATSKDGVHWSRSSRPVLIPTPGAWDATNVETPSVLVLPDRSFRLYYTGGNNPEKEVYEIGLATSSDGLQWTKHPQNPVLTRGEPGSFDHYSVLDPSVLYKDGSYWMWYVGISDAARTAIGLATSRDGVQWTKRGVVLELDVERRTPGDAGITNPNVIWNGQAFEMFYTLLGKEGAMSGPIFHAVSADGVHWKKDAAPVLRRGTGDHWTAKGINSPCVLYEHGTYRMWFAGMNTDYQTFFTGGIGMLVKGEPAPARPGRPASQTQPDAPALNVLLADKPVFRSSYDLIDGFPRDPWVIQSDQPDARFVLYYAATKGDFSDPAGRIFRAVSRDGVSWTRSSQPIFTPSQTGHWDSATVGTPAVVTLADHSYRMYYTGGNDPESVAFQIGAAKSTDGVMWERERSHPVVPKGPTGSFDEFSASNPSVLIHDDQFLMWYVGISIAGHARIGFATSSDGINWKKHGPVLRIDREGREGKASGLIDPHVIWNGKAFEIFYVVLQNGGQITGPIWHAVSLDGKQWVKDKTPLLERGPDNHWTGQGIGGPSVLVERGRYSLWYSGIHTDGSSYYETGIGRSISRQATDGTE